MERKPAVAVIFHHIGPYHHARLNAAADRVSVTGIEWSAKGYDAWGAAEAPARYHKISLFSEAAEHYPASRQRLTWWQLTAGTISGHWLRRIVAWPVEYRWL